VGREADSRGEAYVSVRLVAAPEFTFPPEAFTAYPEAFRDSQVIHATSEEYGAGPTIDHAHDLDDQRPGRKISCPVLVLWGEKDAAGKVTGCSIYGTVGRGRRWRWHCRALLPEEEPSEDVLVHLQPFLERMLVGR
jgi:haloacetate dehalogenase